MSTRDLILIMIAIIISGVIIGGCVLIASEPQNNDGNVTVVNNNTTNNTTSVDNLTEDIPQQNNYKSSEYPKHIIQSDGNEYDDAGPSYSESERYRGEPTDAQIVGSYGI